MKAESPALPVISIFKSRAIEKISNETIRYYSKASVLQLIDSNTDWEMFSIDGSKWKLNQYSDKFKDSKFTRFLAKTFYNPRFDVTNEWIKLVDYKLDELKEKIVECIDNDDDILTHFVPDEFLKDKIRKATDFNTVLSILDKYALEVTDEEAIWSELKGLGYLEE